MRLFILLLSCATLALGYPNFGYYPPSRLGYEHSEDDLPDTAEKKKGPLSRGNLVQELTKLKAFRLLEFLTYSGLIQTLADETAGPFTILAPTNEAFNYLLKCPWLEENLFENKTIVTDNLEYHVIAGEVLSTQLTNDLLAPSLATYKGNPVNLRANVYVKKGLFKKGKVYTIEGRRVVKADVRATNGVIHVIDGFLYPVPRRSIGGLLADHEVSPGMTTLESALIAADLNTVLDGPGPFTLFAPSNFAFSKLPPAELAGLLADKAKLTEVLKYHVAPGTYYSLGLGLTQTIPTLQGQNLTVHEIPYFDRLEVNGNRVVDKDLAVANGVVHLIDTVLMPPVEGAIPTRGRHALREIERAIVNSHEHGVELDFEKL